MSRQTNFIETAKKIAQLSTHPKYKVGAVLTKGKRIISFGVNKEKSHPLQINPHTNQKGSSIHAELDCVIKAHYPLIKGSDIYVARLLKNGNVGLSRPCISCISILKEYGIKNMVYTLDNGDHKIEIL